MASLIDLISPEAVAAKTKEARDHIRNISPFSAKAMNIQKTFLEGNFDDHLDHDFRDALYNVIKSVVDEPLPPLEDENTGETPLPGTVVCMLDDDNGHNFGIKEPFIFIGGEDNDQGLKLDGTIEEGLGDDPHWRYAFDEEIADFFRRCK